MKIPDKQILQIHFFEKFIALYIEYNLYVRTAKHLKVIVTFMHDILKILLLLIMILQCLLPIQH